MKKRVPQKFFYKVLFLTLILTSFSIPSVIAQIKVSPDFKVDNIYYSIYKNNPNEVTVTCKKGKKYYDNDKNLNGEIVIPESVVYKNKTYRVTKIGSYAFASCINITSVVIPNSVKKIGHNAFSGCRGLTKVTIPDNVNYIGPSAFSYCDSLTYVTLPNSIDSIDRWTFQGCKNLTEITIGNNVKRICYQAFSGCSKLHTVRSGFSIEIIESGAFEGCKNLKKFTGLREDTRSYTPSLFQKYKESFDYFANSRIIPAIKAWQKKNEFETTEQYRARLTKENQDKKVRELMNDAIKAYTKEHPITATLDKYDADNQIFKIQTNYGDKYVRVPLSSATTFKNKFSSAKFDANYYANDGDLLIDDLTIVVDDKTYKCEKTAVQTSTGGYDFALPTLELPYQQQTAQQPSTPATTTRTDTEIDKNIPSNAANNKNTFAVIIGNEKYQRVAQVPYANNDARIFAEYCKKTLGLPSQNVRIYENATYGTLLSAISDIKQIASAYNGNINVLFYYAGHGIPNESTKDAFLLPVDADGQQTEVCYAVSKLYKELGSMGAKSVVVFMDACFSGAQRGEGMLASARGIALKANADKPQGNMVVFSAASGDETAFPYKEKGHGMFTYFLLKKLQETKGNCTLGELGEYITTNVRQQSVVINRKSQTPTVIPSIGIGDRWENMTLK